MEDDAQELERLRTENAQLRQALAMIAAAAKAAARPPAPAPSSN